MTDGWRLVIEHADGSDDTELNLVDPDDVGDSDLPSLSRVEIDERLHLDPDETNTAEVAVYADAWRSIEDDIDRIDDRFLIYNPDDERRFGGRLRDDQYQSSLVVSVLLDGAKRDAIDAEASGPNEVYEPQPDDDLVSGELLPRIPTIDAGTVERTTDSVAFEESRATPGKSVTKLAEATGAEYRFTPAFELDWVDGLGSDRSETLTPAADSVIGEPTKERDERELATHVTVLGAGEGTAQVEHTVAIDEDTNREIHRKHSDKDIQREERAEAVATQIADEIEAAPRAVDLTLDIAPSVEPELGDRFPVDLPALNVDDEFRVVERKRILDDGGDRYRCRLSNRKLTRESAGEAQAQSVAEFREGNAGQYFYNSDSEGYEPVDEDEPFSFSIPYPEDVIGELSATLWVESQAYRRRVISEGHGHTIEAEEFAHDHGEIDVSHSHDTEPHDHAVELVDDDGNTVAAHDHEIDVSSDPVDWEESFFRDTAEFTSSETFSLGDNGGGTVRVRARIRELTSDQDQVDVQLNLYDGSSTDGSPDASSNAENYDDGDTSIHLGTVLGADERSQSSATVEIEYTPVPDSGTAGGIGERIDIEVTPDHKHDIDDTSEVFVMAAGEEARSSVVENEEVIETTETAQQVATTDETSDLVSGIATDGNAHVEDVSVTINGQTVLEGAGDGDGEIDETVDITGLLDAGRNAVEVTSASLGEVWVGWEFDGIRNGGSAS